MAHRRGRRRRHGGRGPHRRGALQVHRHPGVQAHRGGDGPPAQHGGRAPPPRDRPGRGHQVPVPRHPPHPRGPEGPEPPLGVVHLRRPHRRRQDGAGQVPRGVPLRGRGRAHHAGHVRVPGEAHRLASVRRPSRLRGLRGGRPAHREGPPPSVLRGAVRRGGEGPSGPVQLPAADPRGRSPDRLAGPCGGLQEHRDHHDHEPRHPGHLQGRHDRLPVGHGHHHRVRADEGQGQGGAAPALPPRVPQPCGRRDRVPAAAEARDRGDRGPVRLPPRQAPGGAGPVHRAHPVRQGTARGPRLRSGHGRPPAAPHHPADGGGPALGEDPLR